MLKTLTTFVFLTFLSLSAWSLQEHKDGSVTLSKAELEALSVNINAVVQQAYQAGVKDGFEAVKDNPKLCPKDI